MIGIEGRGAVARQVGRLFGGRSAVALGEGGLLARFAADRDEAAFEALVGRHGPMVLGTCRRMLADPRDVEDAFQATFLVLARRAGSIRDPDRLGPWLHGVARRVAGRSRALAARRGAVEGPGGEGHAVAPADDPEGAELRSALDEELARLPEKYRAPLVLCYLEGLTHDEAARQLRWPVGTVRSRLAGGRDRLRARLTRRGLAPTSAALPATLPVPALSPNLLTTTARLASATGTVPARVAILAKGALMAMTAGKLKAIAAVGLMAGLAAGGVGAAAWQAGEGQGAAKVEAAPARPGGIEGVAQPVSAATGVENHWATLPPGDLGKLQGVWKLADVRPAKGDGFLRSTDLIWKIQGKHILWMTAGGQELRGSMMTLGSAGGEKTIDLIESEDAGRSTTQRGLYQFRGDTLEICMNAPDGPRPAGFEAGVATPFPLRLAFERQRPGGGPVDEPGRALEAANRRIAELEAGLKAAGPRPAEAMAAGAAGAMSGGGFGGFGGFGDGGAPGRPTPGIGPGGMSAGLGGGTGQGMAMMGGMGGGIGGGYGAVGPGNGQPMVVNLPGGSLVLVIPAERDRLTLLNTETGARSTYRAPKGSKEPGVTELSAVFGFNAGGLYLKGPEITQVAAFVAGEGRWYPLDLREPASGPVGPVVGSDYISYRVGRFLYLFSPQAKNWATLELKQTPPAGSPFSMGAGPVNGKMIVPEGDVIHIYNARTGEWTHLDTKEKEGK